MEDILLTTLRFVVLVILAAAATTVLLTCFLSRRQRATSSKDAPLARVWREGYLAGVADERTSATWEVPGYGPNRANPYPGDETQVSDA